MTNVDVGDIWKFWITNVHTGGGYHHLLVLEDLGRQEIWSNSFNCLVLETGVIRRFYGVDIDIEGMKVA